MNAQESAIGKSNLRSHSHSLAQALNVLESACVRFVGQSEWIDMEGVGERDDDKPPNARR